MRAIKTISKNTWKIIANFHYCLPPFVSILSILLLVSCQKLEMLKEFEKKAAMINEYEKVSLELLKENKILQMQVEDLKATIEKNKTNSQYQQMGQFKKTEGRNIANTLDSLHEGQDVKNRSEIELKIGSQVSEEEIKKFVFPGRPDYVDFATYRWTDKQLVIAAEKARKDGEIEKAAQYFLHLAKWYPHSKILNEKNTFFAGIILYQADHYYKQSLDWMQNFIVQYPNSEYFRSARVWQAITALQLGDKSPIQSLIDEFSKKYRNTPEWAVLTNHYKKLIGLKEGHTDRRK